MFRLFKPKNSKAKNLYASALANTRNEVFYREYGVPDSFDGRFDLLTLHIFIILRQMMGGEDYDQTSQDLFDAMFKDMDQTLREMGIGDVGIPKHMKKMMLAFNGRMHAYHCAISDAADSDADGALKNAIARNIYAMELGGDGLNENHLEYMCEFVMNNIKNHENVGEFIMLEDN